MPDQFFSQRRDHFVWINGQTFWRNGHIRDDNVDFDVWVTLCRRCGHKHEYLIQSDRPFREVRHISTCYNSMCRGCRKERAR